MSAVRAHETDIIPPIAKLFSLADARAEAKADAQTEAEPASRARPPRIVWDKPDATLTSEVKDKDRSSIWSKIVLCLNVACLTATVSVGAILAASYRPWQTIEAMNETLDKMTGAEERLRSNISHSASRTDGLIQLRMDRSDAAQYALLTELGGLRKGIDDHAGATRESEVQVEDRLSEMMMSLSELQTAVSFAPESRRSGPKTVAAVIAAEEGEPASVPAPTRSPGADQQASPKFERQEMPDGSVAYRRVD